MVNRPADGDTSTRIIRGHLRNSLHIDDARTFGIRTGRSRWSTEQPASHPAGATRTTAVTGANAAAPSVRGAHGEVQTTDGVSNRESSDKEVNRACRRAEAPSHSWRKAADPESVRAYRKHSDSRPNW